MANIPGISGSILPGIFGGEVKLEPDLGVLKYPDDCDPRKLRFRSFGLSSPDKIHLADGGVWAYVDFSTGEYGSPAMRKLLQTYPEQKIKLLKVALRNNLNDIWHEQDDGTKAVVMAHILGGK